MFFKKRLQSSSAFACWSENQSKMCVTLRRRTLYIFKGFYKAVNLTQQVNQ
tara:strand:- start:1412 stop:1564 length:153 start_codon:yes stop_codon:yes gene_type:complete